MKKITVQHVCTHAHTYRVRAVKINQIYLQDLHNLRCPACTSDTPAVSRNIGNNRGNELAAI